MMIEHNLKIAFRNLLKYKVQMSISIIGLSAGFVCLSLSLLWIRYEMSYDSFHEGADRIYLAGSRAQLEKEGFDYETKNQMRSYLIKNCPEVEIACSIWPARAEYYGVRYEKGDEFLLPEINADTSFVSMFVTVLEGNTPLRLDKTQIAITDKAVKRIFGKESPLGKELAFTKRKDRTKTIVAVVKSFEGPSLFSFDILHPYFEEESAGLVYTLFRVHPNSDIKKLEDRLKDAKLLDNGYEWPTPTSIAPLTKLRGLHPREDMNVKMEYVWLFACIGALVVICGLCNYLAVLVTRIRMRKRELAIRKVNGASDGNLLALVLSELFLLLVLSFSVGTMVIELILPDFKQLSQINESTSFFYREILIYMLSLIGISVAIATVLVYYTNKRTLSDRMSRRADLHFSGWFYKGSLLFQLFISIGFVFCTSVMMKQLNYVLNTTELGLDRRNVGVFTEIYHCEEVPWSNILSQMPDVIDYLDDSTTPIPRSSLFINEISDWEGKLSESQSIVAELLYINQKYVDFFGIEILQGAMFNEKNSNEVLINETAAKVLGWKDPVGKNMTFRGQEVIVKGVIKDIYHRSPIHPVEPAVFKPNPDKEHNQNYIFRVKEGSWNKVCKALMTEAKKASPDARVTLRNMDEVYNSYMKSELNLMKLLSVVSIICIVISVFGIFSLVTLSCQQRCKEVAIRKVNGASVGVILNLFFKEYMILLVIASCMAFSLGYVIMKHWLEVYMKQTSIDWWVYTGVFALMALIIFLSIIWRVWKTARQNPAEVIKSE